jgi:hypothetical protein
MTWTRHLAVVFAAGVVLGTCVLQILIKSLALRKRVYITDNRTLIGGVLLFRSSAGLFRKAASKAKCNTDLV